ncbi:MAG: hypothetical protein P8J87_19595, partial [Verrucomicrobiales bacterium]|nr:hypothetical protein [Verrucomicrobiales bacterium]
MMRVVLLGVLAWAGGAAGETLFEKVLPGESGVDFVYRWNPPEKYDHEMVNAVTGGGVCVGDYDGDGLADLFLTQPFLGCRLYRNLGGWMFEDVRVSAGLGEDGQWGTGA